MGRDRGGNRGRGMGRGAGMGYEKGEEGTGGQLTVNLLVLTSDVVA